MTVGSAAPWAKTEAAAAKNARPTGRENGKIELEREIARPIQANSPQGLPQKFVALATMKFVKEAVEVARRRLFVSLQSKQFRDFVIVQFVHLQSDQVTGFFRNSSR